MSEERRGFGRLSSIDLLPEEASPDVSWAAEELRSGKRLQKDIRNEFNARLADRGIGPISVGAFSRYAFRKAQQFRELDEICRIGAEVKEALGTGGADQLTSAVAEMAKVAAYKRFEEGAIDPKGILELSRAVQAAASAQKISAEYRRSIEQETKAKIVAAVDKAKSMPGMSAETIEAIKSQILGVRL